MGGEEAEAASATCAQQRRASTNDTRGSIKIEKETIETPTRRYLVVASSLSRLGSSRRGRRPSPP